MASSPKWKKPTDVMKNRLSKRRKSVHIVTASSDLSLLNTSDTGKKTVSNLHKRKNPFGSNHSVKKQKSSNVVTQAQAKNDATKSSESSLTLFTALEKPIVQKQETVLSPSDALQLAGANYKQSPSNNDKKEDETKVEVKCYPAYPIDWTLKSKVRFISEKSFSWCAPLKTNEESSGVTLHARTCGRQCDDEDQLRYQQVTTGDCLDAKKLLQKCCLLWSHPHMPWLRTFPRFVNETKSAKVSAIFHDESVRARLLSDWTCSLTSLFHMLRYGHCPYFYLCAHFCTVLFRAANVGGVSVINAIMTPSTRGLREALKTDGVEFTMPLCKSQSGAEGNISTQSTEINKSEENKNDTKLNRLTATTECDDVDSQTSSLPPSSEIDDADDITHTDAGASSWLETLGLDRKKYRSLDPDKVKMQRDAFKAIDNRPESAVYVQGPAVTALFNFLLNCRSCVSPSGELAGVPPTLLAPTPFKSATLTSLAVKQGVVRQQLADGAIQEAFSVELTGPVLPYELCNMQRLFHTTQGAFVTSCSVQETTTPFNMALPGNDRTMEEYLNDELGDDDLDTLPPDMIDRIKHRALPVKISDVNNGRQVIKELKCQNDVYSWS